MAIEDRAPCAPQSDLQRAPDPSESRPSSPRASCFRALLEPASEPVWILDRDGTIVGCSSVETHTRQASQKIIGQPFSELHFFRATDRATWQDSVERATREEALGPVEIELRGEAGNVVWVEVLPTRVALGGEVRQWLMVRDMTARKRVNESMRFVASFVDRSPDSILSVDRHWRVTYVNPATETLFGWRHEELVGQHLDVLSADPREPERHHQTCREAILGNTLCGETLNKRKDGTLFPCRFDATALAANDGEDYGHIVSHRDVSQESCTEAENEALREQFLQSQKMETVGRLAGGVAHDVNNVLGVIVGLGHALQRDLPSDDAARHDVQDILTAAHRGRSLLGGLLSYSRREGQVSETQEIRDHNQIRTEPIGGSVLVIDDEDLIRKALKRMLESEGYQVILAQSGAAAIAVYGERSKEICLVVLDVVMPEMDGVECLAALREIDPSVKVVVCTGHAEEARLEDLKDAGVAAILSKPVDVDELVKALEEAMASSESVAPGRNDGEPAQGPAKE